MPKRSAGEGTVEQLSSGKYRASRYAGKDESGRMVRQRKTFDRKADAVKWLRSAADERRGEWSHKTLGEWLDKWLADRAGTIEPATLKWYRDRIKRRIRPALGKIKLGELTSLQVTAWLTKMASDGIGERERHGSLKTLRSVLRTAVDAGQISRNAAKEGSKLPKLKARSFTVWTAEQVQAFLSAAADSDVVAYWWLALDTGMRPGELFGLHWPQVDTVKCIVDVTQALEWITTQAPRLKDPKTEAGLRTIRITRATADQLIAHRAQQKAKGRDVVNGPVFVNRWGTWMRPKETGARMHKIAKVAGIPRIRLYDLRHTSATLLLAADVNIKVVSQRLGHTDIAITLRHYAGFLPQMQEKAVTAMGEVLRLPTGCPQDTEQK